MHRARNSGLILATGIALLTTTACNREATDEDVDTLTVGGDVAMATGVIRVADIMDNPAQYVGDTVMVEADVEEVLTPFSFMLDEDALLAGGVDNDIAVFSPKSAQLSTIDDQWLNNRVRVTGVVRQATLVELERELDWDLTPEVEMRLEGTRPVIVAHRVERIGPR